MKAILSSIGNLGMDRPNLALAALPLRLSQFVLEIAVKPCLRQIRPVRALGRGLVAEIDADDMRPVRQFPLDLADHVAVPAAPGIL